MSVDELKIKNQKSDSAQDDSRNNANLSLKKWNFDLEKRKIYDFSQRFCQQEQQHSKRKKNRHLLKQVDTSHNQSSIYKHVDQVQIAYVFEKKL